MRRALPRITSLLLALVYFLVQVPFAHAVESNLWAERKKGSGDPVLLAAVPNSARPADALRALPKIAPAIRPDVIQATASHPSSPVLDAIPAGAARVRRLWTNPSDKRLVLLVQDVHFNPEAQRNIARVLSAVNDRSLKSSRRPLVVAVEAAFGAFDFSPYRNGPPPMDVVEGLLDAGAIAAASYLGMTSPTPPTFIGGEDLAEYRANVRAYLDSTRSREAAEKAIATLRQTNRAEKEKSLTGELRRLDAKMAAFHESRLSFSEYADYLATTASDTGLSTRSDVDIEALRFFSETSVLEKSIDFPKAERERRELISAWAAKASPDELADLMERARAFGSGTLSPVAFYDALSRQLRAAGLVAGPDTHFARYLTYLRRAESIDPSRTIEALDRTEGKLTEKLATTDVERRLLAVSRKIDLSSKLIGFRLTPDEWSRYETEAPLPLGRDESASIEPFERFYRDADRRSIRMVGEILRASGNRSRASLGAVVSGGFHAERMAQLLKSRGVSNAVIEPVLTRIDGEDPAAYLSAFLTQSVAVEKLFRGERIFLGYFGVNVGNTTSDAMNPRAADIRTQVTRRRSPSDPNLYSWRQVRPKPSWLRTTFLKIVNSIAATFFSWSSNSSVPATPDDQPSSNASDRDSEPDTLPDFDLDVHFETDEERDRREARQDEVRNQGWALIGFRTEPGGARVDDRPIESPEQAAALLADLHAWLKTADILPGDDLNRIKAAGLLKVLKRIANYATVEVVSGKDAYVMNPKLPEWTADAPDYLRVLLNSPMIDSLLGLEASMTWINEDVQFVGVRTLRYMFLRSLQFVVDPPYARVPGYFIPRALMRDDIEARIGASTPELAVIREAIASASPDRRERWGRFFLMIARDYNLPLATRLGASDELFLRDGALTKDGQMVFRQAFIDAWAQRGMIRARLLGWMRPTLEAVLGSEETAFFLDRINAVSEENGPEFDENAALLYISLLEHRFFSPKRPPFNPRYQRLINDVVKRTAAPIDTSRGAALIVEVRPFDGMGDLDLAMTQARYLKSVYPKRTVILAYQHVDPKELEPKSNGETGVDPTESAPATLYANAAKFGSYRSEPEKMAALLGIGETESEKGAAGLKTVRYPSGRFGLAEEVQQWKPSELGGLSILIAPHTKVAKAVGNNNYHRMSVMEKRQLRLYGLDEKKELGDGVSLQVTAPPNLPYNRAENLRTVTLVHRKWGKPLSPGAATLSFPFFATPLRKIWSAVEARPRATKESFRKWDEFKNSPEMFRPDARWLYIYWSPASDLDIKRTVSLIRQKLNDGSARWKVIIKISDAQWKAALEPILREAGFTEAELERLVIVTKGKAKPELSALMEASDWVHASGTGTMMEALYAMAAYGTPVTYMAPEYHMEMIGNMLKAMEAAPDAALPAETKAFIRNFYSPLVPTWVDVVFGPRETWVTDVTPPAVAVADQIHFKRLARYLIENHDSGEGLRRMIQVEEFAHEKIPQAAPIYLTTRLAYAIGYALYAFFHFATRPLSAFDAEAARAFSQQRVAPVAETGMLLLDMALAALWRVTGTTYPEFFARWHANESVNDLSTRMRLAGNLRRATMDGFVAAGPVSLVVTGLVGAVISVFAAAGLVPLVAMIGAPGVGAAWIIAVGLSRQVRLHRIINTPADVLLVGALRSMGKAGASPGRDALLTAARAVVAARTSALGDIHPDELERVMRQVESGVPTAVNRTGEALKTSPALLASLENDVRQDAADGPTLTLRAIAAALQGGETGFGFVDRISEILLGAEGRRAVVAAASGTDPVAALRQIAALLGAEIDRRNAVGYFSASQTISAINLLAIGLAAADRAPLGATLDVIQFESAPEPGTALDRYRMLAGDPTGALTEALAAVESHMARRRQGADETLTLIGADGGSSERVRQRVRELLGVDPATVGIRITDGSLYENAWPMMRAAANLMEVSEAEAAAQLVRRTARFEISPNASANESFFTLQMGDVPDGMRRDLQSRLEVVLLLNAILGARVSLNLIDAVKAYRAVMIAA